MLRIERGRPETRTPPWQAALISVGDEANEQRQITADGPALQAPSAKLLVLPRRLFRKIVVERTATGWQSRIVGFDARFFSSAKSPPCRTRAQALEAAAVASRLSGLPVISIETLTDSGPDVAA